MNFAFAQVVFFLSKAQVRKDPGVIVGPIATVFGYIIDFIFNIVYALTEHHSLGISLIILTILVRSLMLPLAVKQQKSMIAMQKLNPEMEKIKKKYGGTKDPETQKKMNVEIQALYAKNKVNPFSGCLPLLITMPLFFGLNYIMNESFMYVSELGQAYTTLATSIQEDPYYTNYMVPLAEPHVPQKMKENGAYDLAEVHLMVKVLNKFDAADWQAVFNHVPAAYQDEVLVNYEKKQAIERFVGLSLTETAGWRWPGIIIPLLTALTTLGSSYVAMSTNASKDPSAVAQKRMMLIAMPLMMGFMTVSMPMGVGIYWITGSIYQIAQQIVLNKRAGFPLIGTKAPVVE